jgi:beta-phosphoglucomutase-like phosphatase (HAD superfamily)
LQDIQHKKPHPQIYLLAAQKLGVSPKESLVIEDSLDGILSAKAAGMRCVALRHPYTPPQHLLQADWVVDNLKKIPLLIKAI